jgi:hypothetical protein
MAGAVTVVEVIGTGTKLIAFLTKRRPSTRV